MAETMTEAERAVERQQIEEVFRLGGGELDDKPVEFVAGFREEHGKIEPTEHGLKWRYHYDGVPDYANDDFPEAKHSGDYFTAVDVGVEYGYRANQILIDAKGRIYLLSATYDSSGETECPLRTWDPEAEEDAKYPNVFKVKDQDCTLCEENVGDDHGYIYLGNSAEHVYQFVGYERGKHPLPPAECGDCPACEDDGYKPEAFRITDHGADHAQYFQGHGISHTDFKDTATGCGFTPEEALDDALESLAQNGWDTSKIDASEEAKEIKANTKTVDDWHECATEKDRESCEHHWYVSVDVK